MPADGHTPMPDTSSWFTVPGIIVAVIGFFGTLIGVFGNFLIKKKDIDGHGHTASIVDSLQEVIDRLDAENQRSEEAQRIAEKQAREAMAEVYQLRNELARYKLVQPADRVAVAENAEALKQLHENATTPSDTPVNP